MSSPQIQYSGPRLSEGLDPEVRRHLQLIYQKLGNHTQAFQLLTEKAASAQSSTSGSTSGTPATGILTVPHGGTGNSSVQVDAVVIGNGASPFQAAPPVMAGYLLTDNGPGVVPSFQSLFSVVNVDSGPFTAAARDVVLCDTTLGGFTVTLPLAADNVAEPILVKKISSDVNVVTVGTMSGDVIDGSATQTLALQYSALTVIAADSGAWNIFAQI